MFLFFLLGAVVGAFAGAAFAFRHLRSFRLDLAAELRRELTGEFLGRFHHIESQLETVVTTINLAQLTQVTELMNQYAELSAGLQRYAALPAISARDRASN
jgi:hypothetical protein